jgi:hypothetical protein
MWQATFGKLSAMKRLLQNYRLLQLIGENSRLKIPVILSIPFLGCPVLIPAIFNGKDQLSLKILKA